MADRIAARGKLDGADRSAPGPIADLVGAAATPAPPRRQADLVLEGGGVRGVALVGALSVLEEHGYLPQNVAGTSAGAIIAAALGAGYSTDELRDIMTNLDFRRFKDTSWSDRIPLVGAPLSIMREQGIYEGNYALNWIRDVLAARGVRTFADLVHPDHAAMPAYRYRVRVVASDLTLRCLLALPQDAHHLGVEPDDLEVALAVRMSMSIPIFFEPVHFKNPQTGHDHIIVDGALLSNFPVWLFDSDGRPEWPTFGLRLVAQNAPAEVIPEVPARRGGVMGVTDYLKSIAITAMQAHDRMYVERASFARTIIVPTHGIRSTDFSLTKQQAQLLYDSGRTAAEKFFASWNFDQYVADYRTPPLTAPSASAPADPSADEGDDL